MKGIILVLSLTVSSFAFSATLKHCINSGAGVSYSFENCVNDNFATIDGYLGTNSRYCVNSGEGVRFSFINCIDNNTLDISVKIRDLLSYCINIGDKNLSYSYISCVNRNFREIQRHLED